MPITIIPDTGANNIYVNQNTGLNIILSGVSEQNNLNLTGQIGAIVPHNYLNGLQGGQAGQYYHLTSVEYANLVTGSTVDTGAFYPISNPSGYITGVDLTNYSTVPFSTGISGHLQSQIASLNNVTGQFYLETNPSGYITGINQISFRTLIHTGIESTGITFPSSFFSTPRVFADMALWSDTGYLVGIKDVSTTGYTAVFSDIIEETGVYLQTLATLT